ncbi:type II secretion system protein [Pyxidicoccus sp. MSG2]|uniref:type II secretion system protein n=1 Tax=Pyxidicoccus sp. MSG2 TaxID=2996790 RepID=UPI00226EF988|nr:type II secretion system protein [Pyxidicoccus sp. MSG2]MCY1023784.1 type II secretion system protein [Pyxidicoccus sp. MSG2]
MRRNHAPGFTLIESMISLAVLALAMAGTLAGLLHASSELREGELLQARKALLDASTQRLWLADKALVAARAVVRPAAAPTTLAIGAAPWTVDTSAPVTGDPGTGAYFQVLPTGQISHVPGIPLGTSCTDTRLRRGTYCREVLVTEGTPYALSAGQVPAGVRAYTVWLRISRLGEPLERAVVHTEVVIP